MQLSSLSHCLLAFILKPPTYTEHAQQTAQLHERAQQGASTWAEAAGDPSPCQALLPGGGGVPLPGVRSWEQALTAVPLLLTSPSPRAALCLWLQAALLRACVPRGMGHQLPAHSEAAAERIPATHSHTMLRHMNMCLLVDTCMRPHQIHS